MMFAIAFASGVAVTLPLMLSRPHQARSLQFLFGPFLAFGGACLFVMPGAAAIPLRLCSRLP
jgi:hypothetical protein